MEGREFEFLKRNGIDVGGIDRKALLQRFIKEMDEGLAGRPSSLYMIPSYITLERPVKTDTPVVVLDAGGTNLRSAVVTIDSTGKAQITSFNKGRMPGTQGRVGAKEFFTHFADMLMPVIDASEMIGFCFSYAAEVTPQRDARLIKWSKQIDAPEIEGALVGAGLLERLAMRGYKRDIVILNDTVATLLAGRCAGVARDYSAYVGFILGTGTNTAYVERNARIGKRPELDQAGSMVINVESGAFQRVEQSHFDRLMDATTKDCGRYTFEKMISGAYLGAVGSVVLTQAAREGLLSASAGQRLAELGGVSTKHLDDFCGGNPTVDNPFLESCFSAADRKATLHLCVPIFERAAVLTAVNLASAIIKTGAGEEAQRPVCVNVDGSTYYRTLTADFQQRVQSELAMLLAPRALSYELVQVDDSPIIGAAVAGLMG